MHRILLSLLGTAFLGTCVVTPASATYMIEAGDVLEVSVAGIPDLKQRSMVDPDGMLAVPMIAAVHVGGLDLDHARELVKASLSEKIFQQRAVDGKESVIAISPGNVLVSVVEYRPVYLSGDVTKPGEQVYRPGLTVAQAVALAGGYEIMRFRMNNPFLESADLRKDYETQWLEYVQAQANVWRLKSELKQQQPSLEELTRAPLPTPVLDEVRRTARSQLALAEQKVQAEKTFLQGAADTSADEVRILKIRQGKEDEGTENDRAEYAKLKEFSEHGNLPIMRLAEVRRLYLFSATQSLQTSVSLNAIQRDRDEYLRKISRVEEDHRTDVLRDLNEAIEKRDNARSSLHAIGEKITYTGMIRSQLTRGGGGKPTIMITHAAAGGGGQAIASETTEVRPGDTIDVALHTETPEQPTSR